MTQLSVIVRYDYPYLDVESFFSGTSGSAFVYINKYFDKLKSTYCDTVCLLLVV